MKWPLFGIRGAVSDHRSRGLKAEGLPAWSQVRTEKKMKSIAFAAALGMIVGCITALAAERSISQKGKIFSETELTIKRGDTLIFVNDDSITHNIFSTSAGNTFNIGAQAPGVATPVKFAAAGEVSVLCAIHPRMQMAVKVTE
jgi:plastocyanin